MNSLSSFVYGIKTQLGDQEGLGGKISDDDKKALLATVKETADWIDENGSSASVEDLEEKLAGMYTCLLDVQPTDITNCVDVCYRGARCREPHHEQAVLVRCGV